jgi:hypothetical protein
MINTSDIHLFILAITVYFAVTILSQNRLSVNRKSVERAKAGSKNKFPRRILGRLHLGNLRRTAKTAYGHGSSRISAS